MVSRPWSVEDAVSVDAVEGLKIDQAFIGSCTNGRMEDLRVAAGILKGKNIAPGVRLLIAPASDRIYQQCLDEKLMDAFLQAGAVICNPGCSACFGGQGMLWEGEVCIGTHNRNFRGRMGHKDAKVYLASPETVAKSAIAGRITDPRS
jgi:3-isopropylmalate/(R)-2-methylmalate dehydratase large subunit